MTTPTTWNSAGSTDANNAANYSAGLPADAAITLDATSVVNWILTANLSVESIAIAAAYTGVVTMTGFTVECSEGFSDDGTTGAHTYGTSITCNGNSATMHVGSGLASISATGTDLYMNGTTAMVLDIDKGMDFKTFTLGANAVVTSSGAAQVRFVVSGTPLTFTNGGTLTVNFQMVLRISGAGPNPFIAISAGTPTINGSATLIFECGANNGTFQIPALTITGTLTVAVSSAANNNTVDQLGNLTLTTANEFRIRPVTGSVAWTYNTANYSISCAKFVVGSAAGGVTLTVNFGSSSINCTSFDGFTNQLGTNNINFQTSQWTCSGNWQFGTAHTMSIGTSVVTITNTSTVTSNGKQFYHFRVNSGANTVTLGDALVCSRYTLLSGTLAKAGNSFTVLEWNALVLLLKKKAAMKRILLTS